MKTTTWFLQLLFCIILSAGMAHAQEEPDFLEEINKDELGEVNDQFQEHFFEALKQKAIENYEKAIEALESCEKIEPDNPVVFFELGKNYKLLKDFDAAISNFQKANRLKPNEEWVLVELMEAYYLNKDYNEAIVLAKKLIPFNSKYQENLANLYLASQQFNKLLTLLDQLDQELGFDKNRNDLRQKIYAITDNSSAQIQVIKDAIKANPDSERNYLNLILVYSEQGMEEEAFEAAKKMQSQFPTSNIVHLALYKFYLSSNETAKALNSMKVVFEAEEIDGESKFKVLTDFLMFVNENPEYKEELTKVTTLFSERENSPEVYQKLGEYYLMKNEKDLALSYFEIGVNEDLDNFELLKNTLLLQVELSKFAEAAALSEKALEIFPGQPVFYFVRGLALNQQEEYKEAEEILTFGLDYLLDDQQMAHDFHEQLVISYKGMGNPEKALEFQEKANQFKKTIN